MIRFKVLTIIFGLAVILVVFKSTPSQIYASFSANQYLYGVFEDAQWQSTTSLFTATIADLQNHNMNGILFTNNTPPDLTPADTAHFNVVAAPMPPLYQNWYPTGVPLDINIARNLIYPLIDPLRVHPSLIGYNIRDDAVPALNAKFLMAKQVIEEHDPINSVSPLLVGNGQGHVATEVYDYLKPKTFTFYNFPFRAGTSPCQVFVPALNKEWIMSQREMLQFKPEKDPSWWVLQAHRTVAIADQNDPTVDGTRQPSPEEMRLQFWEALGEEAKGIFWFTYSDMFNNPQGWTGLKNLPAQYAEANTLGARFGVVQQYLSASHKIPDRFSVGGDNYISTFQDKTKGTYYVLAVNQSCSAQDLIISSNYFSGSLRDVETNQTYTLNSPISFQSGDGKLFEVMNPSSKTLVAAQPNLVINPSFENIVQGKPFGWTTGDPVQIDTATAHSGSTSLGIGPTGQIVSQNIVLKPNTNYYFSYWIKAQNLQNDMVGMQVLQTLPTATMLTEPYLHQTGSYDWKKRVGFFKTPSDTVRSRIDIVWSISSAGHFWIDDVVLCETSLPCQDEYLKERLIPSGPSPTPASMPGDANGDNKVDGIDYVIWLNNYNKTLSGGASVGDFNSDTKIDGADYSIWLNNYNK